MKFKGFAKHLKLLIITLFCLVGIATAGTRLLTTYENSVTGSQNPPAPGVVRPLYLDLQITGDTPGSFRTSIQYNNSNDIVGGEWTQTVVRSNEDGTTTAAGTLKGTFSGGKVILNEDGSQVLSVNDAVIVVESGTGTYESVNTGSGKLHGSFSAESTFSGTYNLTF